MEVESNSVTLKTGRHTKKKMPIAFALQALLALFDTKETTRNDNNNNIFNNEALGLAPSLSLLLIEDNNNKSNNLKQFVIQASNVSTI